MFNLVMGMVMLAVGVICIVKAFGTSMMAGYIFFGILMLAFGIIELIRSKSMRQKKKAARDREFDMYTMIASQMGVKINPLTGEIVGKDKKEDSSAE